MDTVMKNVALILRSLTDFVYILHIIFQIQISKFTVVVPTEPTKEKVSTEPTKERVSTEPTKEQVSTKKGSERILSPISRDTWLFLLLIDILAIVPIPQVIVLVLYSKMGGSRSLTSRKFMNLFLLFQYVPRILRIYQSSKEFGKECASLTKRVWAIAAFNFFLYIVAGHVLGALWYFHSILRETACWHHACRSQPECTPDTFICDGNTPMRNVTFLNHFCPVDPPNEKVFNFGIFAEAIQSGILGTVHFPKKFIHCFWWGLRNLSSYGQNLETSGNIWEICFAVLISILGLLLFLYLIGNVQIYMELATKKSEDKRQKIDAIESEVKAYLTDHSLMHKKKFIMRYIRSTIKENEPFKVKQLLSLLEDYSTSDPPEEKEKQFMQGASKVFREKNEERIRINEKALSWISNNDVPENMRPQILQQICLNLKDADDVDVGNLLPILYSSLRNKVTKELCKTMLQKVPILYRNEDEKEMERICQYLKPRIYREKSYIIRKGEPIDFILFITQGVALIFRTNGTIKPLEKGDYHGEQLINWQLKSSPDQLSYSDLTISSTNVICHTKVEAFALMAVDLKELLKNPPSSTSLRGASSM